MESLSDIIGLLSFLSIVVFGVLFLTKIIFKRGRFSNKQLGIILGSSFVLFITAVIIAPPTEEPAQAKPNNEQLEKEKLNSKISDAQDAYIAEDYDGVITMTTAILADYPDNKKASSLKGKAEEKLQQIEINDLISSAEESMNKKDYNIAIIDYDRALAIDPDHSKVQELKTVAEKKQADVKKLEEEKARKADEARIAQQKENERKKNEARIAKQKENERKAAEAKAQKENAKRASAAQVNSSPSSSGSTSPNSSAASSVQNTEAPTNCDIKGSVNGIYHTPGSTYYNRTKNVTQWFCSTSEAEAAGYRAPQR